MEGLKEEETTYTNKLSFRLHYLKKHGTKKAIEAYVRDIALPELTAILSGIIPVVTGGSVADGLCVDMNVYNPKGRKMRMVGSSKDFPRYTENRPLKIVSDDHTVVDSLITYIPPDSVLLPEPVAVVASPIVIPTAPTPENSIESEEEGENDLLHKVIQGLDVKRVNGYDSWLRIGIICFNEGVGFEPWFEISKKSKHYQSGTRAFALERWKTFKKGSLSQATLWKWLKEDNPTLFVELTPRRNDFWRMLTETNHAVVAQYFYNLKPDAYLFHEELKWFQLMPTGVWKHYDKSPSGLLNDIWATMRKVAKEHYALLDPSDKDERNQDRIKKVVGFSGMIGNKHFLDGVVGLLPPNYNNDNLPKLMDESRNLFAFENKVVDLDKRPLVIRDILPTDYVCLHTGYKYPETRNPTVAAEIRATFNTIWEDTGMVEYMLRIIASQLHGTKKFEEFYVWTGRGGNGKGLLSKLLERALGDYFHSIPSTCITKPSDKKDAPNPPIAKAKGKRFVQAQEPEAEDKLQIGTIKEYTGGDTITARCLYGNTISFVPQFGLFLQTNGIPVLNKIDGGIKRRLRIIKFPFDFKEFPTEKHHRLANVELKDKISKSQEWRDEFIHLLLEVFPTIGSSLATPPFVKEETDEYLGENNLLRDWLPANYEHNGLSDREYLVSAQELLTNYKLDNPDRKDMTPAKLKSMMEMCGVQQMRMSNNFKVNDVPKPAGSYYVGLKRRDIYGETE